MLQLIFGACDSSKSEYLYSQAIDALSSSDSFLVVPEQMALTAEKRIYELAESRSSLGLEVLNFERLAETVFRKCGFLAYNYISDSAKKLLLRKAMTDIRPSLGEYGVWTADENFISNMLSQITEFKHSRVTPETLSRVSKKLKAENPDENSKLISRLEDLSLIYAAYNTLISENYDDRGDDLSKCSDLILENSPFDNASFFFDEFNGFTEQQYEVLYALLKTGNNVFITLCHPGVPADKAEGSEIYSYTYETEAKLIALAEKTGSSVEKKVINDSVKYNSEDLKYICKHFSLTGRQASGQALDGAVRAISCADIFDECETLAALIAEDVRFGLRYRDIAIITRDTTRYKGIIDAVLERHNIPVFFSVKTDICEKSLVRFILSAFSICSGKTNYNDIITHIRCGLTRLDENECDLLETYASTWKIKGKAWWNPDGFSMNPRGYVPFSENDTILLEEINAVSLKLMSGLESFRSALRSSKCVLDFSKAVYSYLKEVGVTEALAKRSVIMKSRGEDVLAKEEAGLWGALCSALDTLSSTVGTLECDTDTYLSLLRLVLNDTEVGTIPQSNDVVTIGDASLIRADAIKHTYLIGCEEGVFPGAVNEPALLSRRDRQAITSCDVSGMEFDPALEASTELFWFYRAATSPSDKLTLTYSRLSEDNEERYPSSAFLRICNMFEGILTYSDNTDISKRIISPETLSEYLPYLEAHGYEKQISALLSSDEQLKEAVYRENNSIIVNEEKISAENINSVFKGDLSLSQTATDAFANCPFSFHCKYSVKLKERANSRIEKNDIGTLIHSVLQAFLETVKNNGMLHSDKLDFTGISKMIKDITERQSALILEFTPENKKARVSHMLKRLSEATAYTAENLVLEFTQSGFTPTFFELPINKYSDGAVMPIKLSLDDGSYVVLGGISDRVDTMVKGNRLYVRVVDYKSKGKTFSLESIRHGLSLQLLIYLFSIWDNAGTAFKLSAGASPDSEIIPAGAEYHGTSPDRIKGNKDADAELVSELLSKSFKRSGIYLSDSDIINAMDCGLSSRFVPINKKLEAKDGSVIMSIEELNRLKDELGGILTDIGNSIKAGKADAEPLGQIPSAGRKYTACEYCNMKFVCKKAVHDTVVEEE